jgi:hypothetical protein
MIIAVMEDNVTARVMISFQSNDYKIETNNIYRFSSIFVSGFCIVWPYKSSRSYILNLLVVQFDIIAQIT